MTRQRRAFAAAAISYAEDITKLFIENYRLYIEGKAVKLILKEGINKRKIPRRPQRTRRF